MVCSLTCPRPAGDVKFDAVAEEAAPRLVPAPLLVPEVEELGLAPELGPGPGLRLTAPATGLP